MGVRAAIVLDPYDTASLCLLTSIYVEMEKGQRLLNACFSLRLGAALALALIGLALAATGNINIWLTPFYYALGYVFVIFNSLRLVRFGEDFSEVEEARRRIEAERPVKPERRMA